MTVILRKLTRKSVLGFGKHADLTVGGLLKADRYSYLRWVYYNCSNITFMDNILDLISIPEEERITKPGKDVELFKELKGKRLDSCSEWVNYLIKRKSKCRFKGERVARRKRENCYFSKNLMQARNHGKF